MSLLDHCFVNLPFSDLAYQEVWCEHAVSSTFRLLNGSLERTSRTETAGFRVRVYDQGRLCSLCCPDLSRIPQCLRSARERMRPTDTRVIVGLEPKVDLGSSQSGDCIACLENAGDRTEDYLEHLPDWTRGLANIDDVCVYYHKCVKETLFFNSEGRLLHQVFPSAFFAVQWGSAAVCLPTAGETICEYRIAEVARRAEALRHGSSPGRAVVSVILARRSLGT